MGVGGGGSRKVSETPLRQLTSEMRTTAGWLQEGPVTIGITSGASTPDRAVELVLDEVFRTKDRAFAGIEERDCAPPTVSSH